MVTEEPQLASLIADDVGVCSVREQLVGIANVDADRSVSVFGPVVRGLPVAFDCGDGEGNVRAEPQEAVSVSHGDVAENAAFDLIAFGDDGDGFCDREHALVLNHHAAVKAGDSFGCAGCGPQRNTGCQAGRGNLKPARRVVCHGPAGGWGSGDVSSLVSRTAGAARSASDST